MSFVVALIVVNVFGLMFAGACQEGWKPKLRPSCTPDYIDNSPFRKNTAPQLQELRRIMADSGAHAYIIYSQDAHGSEYPSKYDERRCYISGLCGSAGTAVVTADKAAIWTDGRYYNEGEQSLDCNWILMKDGERGTPTIQCWLKSELTKNNNVYVNSALISYKTFITLEKSLSENEILLRSAGTDFIDQIWVSNRPARPNNAIHVHPMTYAGMQWQDKIKQLRNDYKKFNVNATVVSRLVEIAWLYNLRGKDSPTTPVFLSYTIVTDDYITLYVQDSAAKTNTREFSSHLNTGSAGSCPVQTDSLCVQVKEYSTFYAELRTLGQNPNVEKVLINKLDNYKIADSIPKNKRVFDFSVVLKRQAVKNEVEQNAIKTAHLHDAIAFIKTVYKMETEVKDGIKWTELNASNEIIKAMSEEQNYMMPSFTPITASGPNSAVIHYSPKQSTNRNITIYDMYLQDTGGQYLDGTTDTTRTYHFGKPTSKQIEAYTRVLMGAINLASLVFPIDYPGCQIEAFARKALWNVGLDYLHGTGHGIGQYLSVHEGPAGINSWCSELNLASGIKPGMFFSDEPGYYEDHKFGIRLETMMLVVKKNSKYTFRNETFLAFEPVGLVPFERHLINTTLMTQKQVDWLNMYHELVEEKVGPLLLKRGHRNEYNWMKSRTQTYEKSKGNYLSIPLTLIVYCALSFLV